MNTREAGSGVRRVALVTDDDHPGLQPDDVALPAAFAARGVEVEPVPWGAPVPRERFDLAVVRTPWDYFLRAGAFLSWVDALEVPVVNPADVLRWNHDKRYLLDLAERGAARLPATVAVAEDARPTSADSLLARLGAERAVLKPAVSAGAHRTRVLAPGDAIEWTDEDEGVFLAQSFVDAVASRGEWSLMVFGGIYSHAVRKTAAAGDFRVQEEHGGGVHSEAAPAALVAEAERVLAAVPRRLAGDGPLPYARVDLVEAADGRPLLMELELIEPELFLRFDDAAPARFVAAVLAP